MKSYTFAVLAVRVVNHEAVAGSPGRLRLLRQLASLNFGPHATHQCVNPVATLTNKDHGSAKDLRIPPRDDNGDCNAIICVGDCVEIIVDSGDEKSVPINVVAGQNLPNPGNCSDIAIHSNEPPGSWDFDAAGACGKGFDGYGFWKNCFVHDVCVWARCTDDNLLAGRKAGGKDDEFCGASFKHAREDYLLAHGWTRSCYANENCNRPLTCLMGVCILPQDEGYYCDSDLQCKGYCQLFKCRGGDLNDLCQSDSDCQAASSLSCQWHNAQRKCRPQKNYGDWCGQDADCGNGLYCQFAKCRDGRRDDKCRSSSECQGSLSCKKRCRICGQKVCK